MLILSGDHLYRMDYMDFVQVINTLPVSKIILHSSIFFFFFSNLIDVNITPLHRITDKVVQILPYHVCPWMTGKQCMHTFEQKTNNLFIHSL